MDYNIPSPAELLFTRKVKANLPVKIENPISSKDRVHQQLTHRQEKQKEHYDRGAKDLPPLIPKQPILVQNPQSGLWEKAEVKEKCMEPRSYKVTMENGHTLRRNRRFIREDKGMVNSDHKDPEGIPPENLGDQPISTTQVPLSARPRRDIKRPSRLIEEV